MKHSAESIFVIEYILKYQNIFETALAHVSMNPWGIVWWKKPEVENLVRLSL
jgi:hypothetical protein